jgi:hypothetical protein
MSTRLDDRTEADPYDTPPWRSSHSATSPNGVLVASIDQAFEHSMGNPTVGTLRISDGLELANCNPAFIWSDDSRYLAVPQWCRRFGLFRRQRLAVIDTAAKIVYLSSFTHWLMLPKTFDAGRLEIQISSSIGITWWKESPITITVPADLSEFKRLKSAYG